MKFKYVLDLQDSDVLYAADISEVLLLRWLDLSRGVAPQICWLVSHFMFHFDLCCCSHLTSYFTAFRLRIDSPGDTNWWKTKQPAALCGVLWFETMQQLLHEFQGGGVIMSHSRVVALIQFCALQSMALGFSSGWPQWVTASGYCDHWSRRFLCRSRTWKQAAVTEG